MKVKKIMAVALLPLNVLLLFFLCFSSRIVVPAWLQVPGRTHPLLLHFPIVLVLLYAAWVLCLPRQVKGQAYWGMIEEGLLVGASFSAVLTALTGFLLSKEAGYEPALLISHQWWGAGLSFLLYLLYIWRPVVQRAAVMRLAVVGLSAVLVVTAHLGGNITHGENFVWAPVTPAHERTLPPLEEAVVFNDIIQPILENKCLGCHNDGKAKGGLILTTQAAILKGGKSGALWDTTRDDLGLLMQRVHLPEAAKKHMPPIGKPQLTADEMNLLRSWIGGGAVFEKKVVELPDGDSLKTMAAAMLRSAEEAAYDFEPAAESKIQALSNNNRVVSPIAAGSPALAVSFYNQAFYNTKELEALRPLENQIVALNLDRMPVRDADLAVIARMKNLRRLHLSFTAITGAGLATLTPLTQLKSISLSGTPVTVAQVTALRSLPQLRAVYIWHTGIGEAEWRKLAADAPQVKYYHGFKDTAVLKIIPPVIENESLVITQPIALKLKHYIGGSEIRYTLDGQEPDSIHALLYTGDVLLKDAGVVKAKAFHKGWLSSDVVQKQFFRSTWQADSAWLATDPEPQYKGKGAALLIDRDKSEPNYRNGKWLGYHGRPVMATLLFREAATVSNITISMMQSVDEHIFPPASIQVWGGPDTSHLRLLQTLRPPAPGQKDRAKEGVSFASNFAPAAVRCVRVVLKPIDNIVPWVKDKKAKSWLFIDEVFVN